MPLLIDGHNLIGQCPTLSLDDPDDEEKLVRLLVQHASRTGKQITVVFDPGEPSALPRSRRLGGVDVVFAPQGTTADAVILRRLRRSHHRSDWQVVTSDQALAGEASRLGARTRTAQEFAAEACASEAAESGQKQAVLTAREVEAWLALFGRGPG